MTLTEALAVRELLRWLAGGDPALGEQEAIEAMELLAERAGRRLQLSPEADLPARIVGRLRAADSDGMAQAVCLALAEHPLRAAHGRSTSWTSVDDALAEWAALRIRDRAEAQLDAEASAEVGR